jgi:hypothetical protein
VSTNAIASSLARTVLEYNQLSERMNLKRPVLSANPSLVAPLNRIRSNLGRTRPAPSVLKILLVVSAKEAVSERSWFIPLAGLLAGEHTVFLSSASPEDYEQGNALGLDDRVVFLEGTLGPTPWSAATERTLQTANSRPNCRCEILTELIRIHGIDVIHTSSWCADRLVLSIIDHLEVPWLIHTCGILGALARHPDADTDIDCHQTATAILNAAAGVFYDHESDFLRLERQSIPVANDTPRWLVDRESPIEQQAVTCTSAYVDMSKLLNFERGRIGAKLGTQVTREVPSRSSA